MSSINDVRLAPLVDIHRDLMIRKFALESELEEIVQEVKRIETESIPSVMDELGVAKVRLSDGTDIRLSTTCLASVSDVSIAFPWLREHGFGGIIRNNFRIDMGVTEDERALVLVDLLADNGFEYINEQKIHPMTLKSWANERISNNESVPPDAFSITPVTRAIVKRKV